jgi:cytochrome c biogenesis protein CcdA
MPFLSPLLVSNSQSVKQSMALVLPFSLGRLFAYTLISMLAFSSAGFIKAVLNDNEVFEFFLGSFTLFMGMFLLYKIMRKKRSACASNPLIAKKLTTSKFGLFAMGVLISINPCTPLLTLIALSANSTSSLHAMEMGIFFGLGAVLVPFLFYGFFISTIMRGLLIEFKTYTKYIEVVAALFLVAVGILLINGQVTL